MVYHQISIYTKNDKEFYNKISDLLNLIPIESLDDNYNIWTHSVNIQDEEPFFDFINVFLDILDPKFKKLEELGITKDDISFWYLYEYDQQCGMEFQPKDMKRLGESGVTLCISCWQKNGQLTF